MGTIICQLNELVHWSQHGVWHALSGLWQPMTPLLSPSGASLARMRQSSEAKSGAGGLASNSTSTSSSRKPKKGPSVPGKPRPYKLLAATQPGNGTAGSLSSGSGSNGASLPSRLQRHVSGESSSSAQNGAAKSGGLNGARSGGNGRVRTDSNTKKMLPDSDEAAKDRDRVGNISASLGALRSCRPRPQQQSRQQERLSLRRGLAGAQLRRGYALPALGRGSGRLLMLK